MARKFLGAIQYIDEVVELVTMVAAYRVHRDESQLAESLTRLALDIVQEQGLTSPIDEEKLRQAVCDMVEALEPVFGEATQRGI